MLFGKDFELGPPRHRAVGVHDLNDDGSRRQPRHARQVYACFGVARAFEDPARFGNEREYMARLLDVPWRGVGRHGLQDGVRALCRADPRPDLLGGIDRYGEIGLMLRAVIPHHQRYIQLSRALRHDRHANQTAGLRGKKIDDLWRDFFRCDDQVTLVFSIFVIHQDDHAARADIVE